jgi:hypothetical protein
MLSQTRKEFLDDFLNFVAEPDDDDARNVAERLLNQAVDSIYMRHPFRQFRAPNAFEITTVANTRSYALPSWFGRLLPRTPAFNLTRQSQLEPLDEIAAKAADPTIGTSVETVGAPQGFFIGGTSALDTEVSTSGTALEAISDNASDTDIVLSIEGMDSTGRQKRAKIQLTGTIAVAIGTWKPPVMRVGKSYPEGSTPATEFTSSRGTVTIRAAGAGATYLTLPADEGSAEHLMVSLVHVPDSVYTIALPYLQAPRRLMYDSDPLPQWWGPALFERMTHLWRVNTGEIPTVEGLPTPEFVNLVAFDNAMGPPPQKRAYR